MGACSSSQRESPRIVEQREHRPEAHQFSTIKDNYRNVDEVQDALRRQGLESSNLILAVDFTKSNEWTGKVCFQKKNLHDIGQRPNPYEEAISIIGKTLAPFDDDGKIPAYGFGDIVTKDNSTFSFQHGDVPLDGLDNVLWRYRELVPHVKLSGPTSFAPAIRQATRIVADSGGQYHILVIVADGQVTRSVDVPDQGWSVQEEETVKAIVDASNHALSIVMVGVGDGPWDQMQEFDDKLPQRRFDNFQFVNFTAIAAKHPRDTSRREAAFALAALMEVPEQFKAIQKLHLLNARGTPTGPALHVFDPPCPTSAPPAKRPPSPVRAYSTTRDPPRSARNSTPTNQAMFLCPITQDIMSFPVLAADGFSYEKTAIEAWLSSHNTSPMTNARLLNRSLLPNHALRSAIQEARQRGEI